MLSATEMIIFNKKKNCSVFYFELYNFLNFILNSCLKFKSDIYLLLVAVIIWIYFISFYFDLNFPNNTVHPAGQLPTPHPVKG